MMETAGTLIKPELSDFRNVVLVDCVSDLYSNARSSLQRRDHLSKHQMGISFHSEDRAKLNRQSTIEHCRAAPNGQDHGM